MERTYDLSSTALAIVCLVGLTVDPRAQQKPASASERPAVFAGRVVDAVSGAAVEGATVQVVPAADGQEAALLAVAAGRRLPGMLTERTEGDGRFQFASVPAGTYVVVVSSDGYRSRRHLPNVLAPEADGGSLLMLEAGQSRRDVIIPLSPLNRLRGQITDDLGEPVILGAVELLRVSDAASGPSAKPSAQAETDDRGTFTFFRLEPGDYVLRLREQRIGDVVVRPSLFYPGSAVLSGATVITLRENDQHPDLSFVAGRPARAVQLSGRLTGGPTPMPPVRLELASQADRGSSTLTTTARADGTFAFGFVTPGEYRLNAWLLPELGPTVVRTPEGRIDPRMPGRGQPLPALPTTAALVVDQPVVVDEANAREPLVAAFRQAARIRGQLDFEPNLPMELRRQLPALAVGVTPEDRTVGEIPVTGVAEDGSFATIGLPPGRYQFRLWTPLLPAFSAWYITSSRVGGREVLSITLGDSDVEVRATVTNRPAEFSVRVEDASGRPVPRAWIILLRRDLQLWSDFGAIRLATDGDGRYRARQLPQGDYLAAAVSPLPDNWRSQEYWHSLRSLAVPVRIAPDTPTAVVLRPVQAPPRQ